MSTSKKSSDFQLLMETYLKCQCELDLTRAKLTKANTKVARLCEIIYVNSLIK